MPIPTGAESHVSPYLRLLRNRPFVLVWSGGTVSTFGDAFFNLTVLWVVYAQTGSTLQTAIVQVVWQLSDALFAPIAGVLADRWDRQRILVAANLLSAIVVGGLAAVMAGSGEASTLTIFVTIFLLNLLSTFVAPAGAALVPSLVGRDLLATAGGVTATTGQLAYLAGSALAGTLISAAGAVWAVVVNGVSFLIAALAVAMARLPKQNRPTATAHLGWWRSIFGEARDGWRVMMGAPVIRAVVLLGMLVNGASFIGPLYPALIRERLDGGAAAYGLLEAAGIAGAVLGGALTGLLERRFGAGRLIAIGWGVVGCTILGVAASPWLPLTFALEVVAGLTMTASNVTFFAMTQSLIPDDYRGRVFGLSRSLAVATIPISALAGGWLADVVGVVPVYAFGGVWLLGCAAWAVADARLRTARI